MVGDVAGSGDGDGEGVVTGLGVVLESGVALDGGVAPLAAVGAEAVGVVTGLVTAGVGGAALLAEGIEVGGSALPLQPTSSKTTRVAIPKRRILDLLCQSFPTTCGQPDPLHDPTVTRTVGDVAPWSPSSSGARNTARHS